ncbi:anthranilate synthase component I [Salimicrobium flavidum]|uniref:anthranilate synthase component I n=1 Tax=Salimicrobium flavidum TaxID=570947 RepID=UPI0009705446|nr:anthranilate synthase component I [Salimicrobium flavidum]
MTTYENFLQDSEHYSTIPVTDTFTTDTITPIHMFAALEDEAVYMLESGDRQSEWSNYSFIGLDPIYSIYQDNSGFVVETIESGGTKTYSSLEKAYEGLLADLQVKIPDVPLPFKGGFVGYVAYDAISDFEPVPPVANEESNYRFVFCRTIIAHDHRTEDTTILSFARGENPQVSYNESKRRISDVKQAIIKGSAFPDFLIDGSIQPGHVELESNYSKEKYLNDVRAIQEYIKAGDIFQAVLSQRFEAKTTRTGFELYRVLRKVNPSPYMFYLNFRNIEVIGSSPERLLRVEKGQLEMHPIAGTRKRGETKEEDDALADELLADEKEQAEHRMLVDLARNDVGRVAGYGTVKVHDYMTIGRFAKVMHIISKVTGEIKEDVSSIDALMAAFPAGTLSGAPKVRAMQILRELEPTSRHIYGGGIVYLGLDGDLDSCIAIRTMTKVKDQVYIQAGAGVVADSDPEGEFEETVNKASALKYALAVAEQAFETRREGVETE